MNELDAAECRSLMTPETVAERRRIQDALRRIAVRYQDGCCVIEEATIRRAIDEIFETPIVRETHSKSRNS